MISKSISNQCEQRKVVWVCPEKQGFGFEMWPNLQHCINFSLNCEYRRWFHRPTAQSKDKKTLYFCFPVMCYSFSKTLPKTRFVRRHTCPIKLQNVTRRRLSFRVIWAKFSKQESSAGQSGHGYLDEDTYMSIQKSINWRLQVGWNHVTIKPLIHFFFLKF